MGIPMDAVRLAHLPVSKLTGKPVLHFAHANGMPSEVYGPMFEVLASVFTIEYIPVLGADDRYPVDDHWHSLTQQVSDSITAVCRQHGVSQLVALGHSLGSLCTLQALYRKCDHIAQLVMLDPPWIYGVTSLIWHLGKQVDHLTGKHVLMDKLSPAGVSKHRRDVWDSRDQAYQQLRDKAFFRQFDERCFARYIEYGLQSQDNGTVTLRIPKAIEVAVFRTNPSWYWLTPNHPPDRPVTIVVGTDSVFYKRKFTHKIKSRLHIDFTTHAGGHMFPLEYPKSVAKLVLSIIEQQAHVR